MSNTNVEETLSDQTLPVQKSKKPSLLLWILGGVLFILMFVGAGSALGYQKALAARDAQQSTQVAQYLQDQFQLALKDYYLGNMENARQRLEAIIQMNPTYPGAVDLLTKVSLAINTTDTPTVEPTETLTPTPDKRGVEELFQQAKTSIAQKDWQTARDALDNLRKADRTYKTVEVDDLYYIILRNQGVQLITQGSLEMGLYDLSLAERFGYLDGQAEGLRSVSRLYLTGASFWEIDWNQAAQYFSQINSLYPSLHDASGMTADERWRTATLKYADQVAEAGDVCKAEKLYQSVVDLGKNPEVKPTLSAVKDACDAKNAPTATDTPKATSAEAGATNTPNPAQPTNTPEPPKPTEPPAPQPTNTPEPPQPTETPKPPPAEASPTP